MDVFSAPTSKTTTRPGSSSKRSCGPKARFAPTAVSSITPTRRSARACSAAPKRYAARISPSPCAPSWSGHKIALHKWLQAFHLMCSQQEGRCAHQLHRTLGIGYEAAWFMATVSVRPCAMGALLRLAAMVGSSKRTKPISASTESPSASKQRHGRPYTRGKRPAGKRAIVSLVERGGRVRSFHPAVADARPSLSIVRENIARETRLHTDESRLYTKVGAEFAAHETVKHSAKEYARGDVHDQYGRRLLLNLQARHARRLSALRREASAPLSCGIRFPLQSPR